MRTKSPYELERQYMGLLKQAFPKLRFTGMCWNWYKVYDFSPWDNPSFMRIYEAYRSTAKKREHPFFTHPNKLHTSL